MQDVGAALLCAHQPVHRDRVIFSRVAAHDQHHVGVDHVDPVIAPLPNEAASPATVELCQRRAWCSTYTRPRALMSLTSR